MIRMMNLHCIIFVLICYITFAFSQEGTCEHKCLRSTCKVSQLSNLCYYRFDSTKRTWEESKTFCTENGLSLVNLAKEIDRVAFTKQSIFSDFPPDEYVWLGGSAQDLPNWTYVNGVPLDGKYAIGNTGSEDGQANYLCGTVSQTSDDVAVERADCGAEYHFICRYDDWEGTPSYYISERKATWFNAKSRCINMGGDLFYLNQNENLKFLKEKLSNNDKFFVGATLRNWQWEDERAIDQFYWNKGEPNTYSEKCIAMYPETGAWFDMGCTLPMHTICQGAETPKPIPPAPTVSGVTTECDNSGFIASTVILCILLLIALMYPAYQLIWKKYIEPWLEAKKNNTTKKDATDSANQDQAASVHLMEDQGVQLNNINNKANEWKAIVEESDIGTQLKLYGLHQLRKEKKTLPTAVKLDASFKKSLLELQLTIEESESAETYFYENRDIDFDIAKSQIEFKENQVVCLLKKKTL